MKTWEVIKTWSDEDLEVEYLNALIARAMMKDQFIIDPEQLDERDLHDAYISALGEELEARRVLA